MRRAMLCASCAQGIVQPKAYGGRNINAEDITGRVAPKLGNEDQTWDPGGQRRGYQGGRGAGDLNDAVGAVAPALDFLRPKRVGGRA